MSFRDRATSFEAVRAKLGRKAGPRSSELGISVAIRLIMIIMIYQLAKVIASTQGMFLSFKAKLVEINGIRSISVFRLGPRPEDLLMK